MSIQLQLRKGNTTQHSAFTGAIAEITVDTTKKTVVVHDGATAGGFPLALKTDVSNVNSNVSTLTTSNIAEGGNLYYTDSRVYSNVVQLGYSTNDNVALKANIVDLNTSNVTEGTNLYFTNNRVYSNVVQLGYITASSLSGYATNSQLNVYATVANVNLKANLADLTTTNVTELTNLYYTNSRVYSNVTQLGYATTGYVDGAVANLVNSAPATLDTLRELAEALGNDASFATTVTNSLASKANTSSLTTSNVVELTNLYYTNARVYANVIELGYITSSSLTGYATNSQLQVYATNSQLSDYATNNNVALKANVVDLTTANVVEVSNLYFTNARAILAAIPAVTQLVVTTPVFNYNIDQYSGDNPTIYVNAGETISFELNQGASHPFAIRVSNGGSNYNTGLTHIATNGTISTGSNAQGKVSGKLFWKIPYSLAGNTYVYQCTNHSSMVGSIVIQKALSTVTTLDISEGSNLYFTNARVYANIYPLLTTANVSEVTNLYFTNARVYAAVTGNLATKANVEDLTTANVVEVSNLYFTNARARQAITAANGINYNTSTGLLTSGLQLQLVDTSNVATIVVANVNTIQFDSDSGFDVVDQANGIAKVQMNSTFKTWNVYGQANLVATGLDVMRFVPGNNIVITTNAIASPQEIRFDADLSSKANVYDLTTANVTELNNLYFTNARVYSNVTQLGYITLSSLSGYATNAQLAEYSTNAQLALYATTANLALKANTVDLTTANVTELNNLYFTNTRVYANVVELGYITSSSLNSYATNAQLSLYATNSQLALYATNNQLSLYATTANLALKSNIVDLNTNNVVEGTNLYFTNNRVYSNVTQLGYITSASLNGYATNSQLGSYATTSNLALKANITDLTTDNVSELNNLFFTNARVYANVVNIGYATNDNVSLKANVADLTTSNVAEGTNLYYSNARVQNYLQAVGNIIPVGNNIQSLGTSTNRFKDLYLSGNTLFLDGGAISLINGELTVTGIDKPGNVVTNSQLTTANVAEVTNLYYTNARVYDNVTQLGYATVSYVNNEVANLVNSAPATLDTLNELAIALGNDASFATTVTNLIGQKANTASLTTANVVELNSLYFSNARAYANTLSAIKTGNGIIFDNTTGNVTLSVSGVTSGTYGNANFVPIITVDTYGRVTNLSSTPVAGGGVTLLSGNNISIVDSTINLVSDFGTFTNPTPARFRLRRGLESDRLSFTPLEGELIYATDSKIVYVGDGSTPGGLPIGNTTTLTSFDGGGPETLVFSNTLDGGSPSSTYSSTLDGGSPE